LIHHQQLEQNSQSPPLTTSSYSQDPASNVHGYVEQYELAEQFSGVSLTEMPSSENQMSVTEPSVLLEQIRKPSPLPEQESWSAQMEETNDAPDEDRLEPNEATPPTTEVIHPSSPQGNAETTSPSSSEPPAATVPDEESLKEPPHSRSPHPPATPPPPPQIEEAKKDGEA